MRKIGLYKIIVLASVIACSSVFMTGCTFTASDARSLARIVTGELHECAPDGGIAPDIETQGSVVVE